MDKAFYESPFPDEEGRVAAYQEVFRGNLGKMVLNDIVFRVAGVCADVYSGDALVMARMTGKQSVGIDIARIVSFNPTKEGVRDE